MVVERNDVIDTRFTTLAPPVIAPLMTLSGGRTALLAIGAAGLVVAAILILFPIPDAIAAKATRKDGGTKITMLTPAILGLTVFFMLLGLSNSAAAENGRFGIRVNAICPGAVDTDMLKPALGRTPDPSVFNYLPLARMGRPDEIAAFIAYLLSDDASYQTAGIYTIDGGMTH